MFIIFSFGLRYLIIPQIVAYARGILPDLMVGIIMMVGIVMILGALGMRISENLGATIVAGIFGMIGYVLRAIVEGIAWVIRNTIRMIPKVFGNSKKCFNEMGANSIVSNILALIVVLLFIAAII